MKKYLALILCVLMLAASLAACGEEVVASGTTSAVAPEATQAPTAAPAATVDEATAGAFAGVLEGKYTSVDEVPDPDLDAADADYQNAAPKAGDVVAILHTSMGDIKIRFFQEIAPKAVNNFIALSRAGKYNNNIFHRVIQNFMIQCGDYTKFNGTGGGSIYGQSFGLEISDYALNIRGALAMANTGMPNSNGSQFYINQRNNTDLDGKYTVFGQVYEGMDVVDAIAAVETGTVNGFQNKPLKDVVLKSVDITNYEG